MPFEIMGQAGGSTASHFFEDNRFPAERQVGFWKPNTIPDNQDKLVASSPLQELSLGCAEMPLSNLTREPEEKIGLEGKEGITVLSGTSWNSMEQHPKSWSSLYLQPAENNLKGHRSSINSIQRESSLFSSSLSEIFSRKLRLCGHGVFSQEHADKSGSNYENEPFESLEEMEARTIGNLLPDEDDLFYGVIDELGLNGHSDKGGELEDFDLFSSGGGMELEGDGLCVDKKNFDIFEGAPNCQGSCNGLVTGEHPYGEHPSRTLFVRNINSSVEDSELKTLFEQYGDIQTLYTACKHRGFVMISYYDIRAAQSAMRALQNKLLRRRKLDIHYSIPKDNPSERDGNQGTLMIFNLDSSVSTEEIQQIFGSFGDVKEIGETPQKHKNKRIEFFDIRAAEAAFFALDKSDIAGKQIKLELCRPCGVRRFMLETEQEQVQSSLSGRSFDDLTSRSMVFPGVVASSGVDNGSTHVFRTVIHSPVTTFMEPQSSQVPVNFPSPARVRPGGNQFNIPEPNHCMGDMNYQNQCIPNFHPHSFPEYHDSLANGFPYVATGNVPDIGGNVGPRVTGLDFRRIREVSSNVHLMEPNGAVLRTSGSASGSLNGNHYMWGDSKLHQQHPSGAVVWPNSSSFVRSVQPSRLSHMPAFVRAPPVMLNTPSPVHHHIGSAPNSVFWDRRHAFSEESHETSTFHLGSLGSVGFPCGSPSHPVEIASRNIFKHVSGNCIDMAKNGGVHSPQQMCHHFPGRNPMISVPASLDSPVERIRGYSHRRNESSNSADKKQYELDIDRIIHGEDNRTTLMIKNIPNKYTSKMILAAIDEHCKGTYDFIYLPIDFKNKCNVGYAFINMVDPQQIIPFYKAFNGKKWEKFNSEKVASLAYARIQGKAALIAHFQNSSLMNEDKRCRPILFHTDGPNAGDQEPFPMGPNIRARSGRPRATFTEENNHLGCFSSSSVNGEEPSNDAGTSLGSSKD